VLRGVFPLLSSYYSELINMKKRYSIPGTIVLILFGMGMLGKNLQESWVSGCNAGELIACRDLLGSVASERLERRIISDIGMQTLELAKKEAN